LLDGRQMLEMVHSPIKKCIAQLGCKGQTPGEFGSFFYLFTLFLNFWSPARSRTVAGKLMLCFWRKVPWWEQKLLKYLGLPPTVAAVVCLPCGNYPP